MYYPMMRLLLIASLVLGATACIGGRPGTPPPPHHSAFTTPSRNAPQPSPSPSMPTLVDALRQCPVTIPNGTAPNSTYGTRSLRTVLWAHGLVLVPPEDVGPDRRLGMKFPWWRGHGVRGLLHISGNEIHSGAPVQARTRGYGLSGFNATAIFFPSEGCYRIKGQAGGAGLTFVAMVLTCSTFAELPRGVRRTYSSKDHVPACA